MNYEEFVTEVKQQIESILGSQYQVSANKVLKNNSTELVGLSIHQEDQHISPTIYLEKFYSEYEQGETIYDISCHIIEVYDSARTHTLKLSASDFDLTYDKCKNRIVMRLISKKQNEKLLQDTPYFSFLDLAVIFTVVYKQEKEGIETARITNTIFDNWGISMDELKRTAIENTPKLFPPKWTRMDSIIKDFLSEEELEQIRKTQDVPLTVLTNTCGINGATVLLYKDVLKKLAEIFESDLFIMPSSIHEVIILPVINDTDIIELQNTVSHVNRVAVSKEEFLSNTVYVYHLETNMISY